MTTRNTAYDKKLGKLISAVRRSVEDGADLDLAIRAEIFAHRLTPQQAHDLRAAFGIA